MHWDSVNMDSKLSRKCRGHLTYDYSVESKWVAVAKQMNMRGVERKTNGKCVSIYCFP